jgi:hypothetical protein
MSVRKNIALDSKILFEFEIMCVVDAVGASTEIDGDAVGLLVGEAG